MLAMEHPLLRMLLNIWHQILFLEDLHDASLYNFCAIEFGTFNCACGLQTPSTLEQLPVYFYLITSQIDMFRPLNLHSAHTMHLDVAKVSKSILFVLTVGYEQCYDK